MSQWHFGENRVKICDLCLQGAKSNTLLVGQHNESFDEIKI